jgi:hypothetical protein
LPDVRSTDARSTETRRPSGVTDSFQVSLYKVEPAMLNCSFNLLAKDGDRSAFGDEMEEGWPKVPLVSKPIARACFAERLTRATSSPDLAFVAPPGLSQGVRPDTDTGEEMALGESGDVTWGDIFNASFINFSRGYKPSSY